MKTVYLAGPVAGCDQQEANNWRRVTCAELSRHGIRGISPLRCEPLIGARYELAYTDPRFGTPRAIAAKNFYDVRACDMTLCYMPRELNERRLSIGTLMELAWAHALTKPTIIVTDYPFLIDHPVVQACAGWVLTSLDEAIDVCVGILEDYS